ncbi:MAG: choice-of-anchor E domain-containing protein [Planctomycetes bacterium]|nr:choice-of-anchor E domain-containing protein [Planctomycetota bacterium]
MIRTNPLPRAFLAASGFLALAGSLQAGGGPGTNTICFTDSIPLQSTNWASSVSIPQFNPNLGTLQSIQFTLSGNVQGTARAESLDNSPTVVNTQFSASITLTRPDNSVIVITIPIANFVDNFTAHDGVIDFGGTSGVTHAGINANDSDMAVSPPPASDLALFTGFGNIVLPVVALGTSIATGSGNLITQFTTQAQASVEVCYTYSVNTLPVFTEPTCGATYMATAGVPFSIQVCAADADVGSTVTLTSGPLPPGAVLNPPLPQNGNPVCTTFEWTPTLADLGTTQICFTAVDNNQRTAACCFNVQVAECYQFLGRGGGNAGVTLGTVFWQSQLGNIRSTFPVTMTDRPNLRVPILASGQISFSMQTLMHNPQQFPQNPDQWSQRLRVVVYPAGLVQGELYGSLNGIHQQLATFTDPNGDLYMTFPFAIDGM